MPPRAIFTPAAPRPVGPYGQAVVAGELVFTVGVVGSAPATSTLVEGGVGAELQQALSNLGAILEAAGSGFDQLIKVTVLVADIRDQHVVLDGLADRLLSPVAVTVIAVQGMPIGAAVEIECVAAVAPGPSRLESASG